MASCASVNTSQQNMGKTHSTLTALSIEGKYSDLKLGEKYVARFEENDSRVMLSDSAKYNFCAHVFFCNS
jgi:hypothetical protein